MMRIAPWIPGSTKFDAPLRMSPVLRAVMNIAATAVPRTSSSPVRERTLPRKAAASALMRKSSPVARADAP